jgi:hypothetical protein
MFPGRQHSVWVFWENGDRGREFSRYFVNLEEPCRRTPIGFDTQDHTLDIVVQPDLTWNWRDEAELEAHVGEGFFTRELAESIRAEGTRVIDEISRQQHPCLSWPDWVPNPEWTIPHLSDRSATTPATFWEQRAWAYCAADSVAQISRK